MAYNPFNIFRRNQKAIFAVITVFIMFTFVLSSGLGGGADFFDWLPRWLGSKSKKGDVLCTIDGSKVYASELDQLNFQRVMANRFMSLAGVKTVESLQGLIFQQMSQISPETRTIIQEGEQAEQFLSDPRMAGSPEIAAMFRPKLEAYRNLANSEKASSADKEVARTIRYVRILQRQMAGSQGEHYFLFAPNHTRRDLVDFMLWQKKADQLGIKITAEDIKKLIAQEFHGFLQSDDEVRIRQQLQQQMAHFSMNRCIDAIGEEFRVRMAQTALLGPIAHGGRTDKTAGGFPLFGTPYEAFEFYREQCSPTTYCAIPVPAVNYLPQVADPNESDPAVRAQLRELFDKYKNNEPNLARETPGLKEPRKIKVDWISITGAEPFYIKLAEEQLKAGELQAKVGSMLSVPVLGGSPLWLASASAPLAIKEPILQAEYDRTVADHWRQVELRYMRDNVTWADAFGFSTTPLDSSIVRPGNLAAAGGGLAGQFLAFGDPRMAAAITMTAPYAYEVRDRVKAGVPALLLALGTIPGVKADALGLSIGRPVPGPLPGPPLFANVLGGLAAYNMLLPKPLPVEALKPTLMKNLIATTARHLAFGDPNASRDSLGAPDPKKKGDVQTFIDEVNKLSDNGRIRASDKEKVAALQKYIVDFVSKRGIMLHGNDMPQSEWNLEEAAELAPLVDVQKKSLKGSPHQQVSQYIPFARSFFWDKANQRTPVSTIYQAHYYPEERPQPRDTMSANPEPQYIVWRTEEIAAKTPASLDDALPAAKAVWKHLKARELAKARAEKLAESIRAGGPGSEASVSFALLDQSNQLATEFGNDARARDRTAPFLIEGVCPITSVDNPTANTGVLPSTTNFSFGQLHEFRILPSENVKYPAAEMRQKVLDERTKPVKTVMLLTDEPKDIYFVVTLLKREMKSDIDFQTVLHQVGSPNRNIILGSFQESQRDKTIESVMGLLKQEFKYEENEEQKKKLDERRGSGEL